MLEVIHDLAAASGKLDAALFAAMVLHEDPNAYARVVGRPASAEARALADCQSGRHFFPKIDRGRLTGIPV